MRIGDIIHKIAEIVDMVEQPEGTNVTATGNDKEPEDLFVPPLQQKMEIQFLRQPVMLLLRRLMQEFQVQVLLQ